MKPLRPALWAIAVASWAVLPPVVLAQAKKVQVPRGEIRVNVVRPAQPPPPGQQFEVMLAPGANRDQARRYADLYRPLLLGEYKRVCKVCDPTRDQRKAMARAGESIINSLANQYASRGTRLVVAGRSIIISPQKVIEDGLALAVKIHLREDQSARYAVELEARSLERKEAAIEQIVAELDQDLCLSAGQREQVRSVLASHWDDSWIAFVDNAGMAMRSYYPSVSRHVAPLLSSSQNSAWVLGHRTRISPVRRIVLDLDPNIDAMEDEDLTEARRAWEEEVARREAAVPKVGPPAGRDQQ